MAKAFLYDSINLLDATLTEGTHDGSSFTPSDSITNHERLIDQSIGSSISSYNINDCIRINLTTAKSIDFLAFYFSVSEDDDMRIYGDSLANGSNTNLIKLMTSFNLGWTISTFGSVSYQYYFFRVTSGTISNFTEMIMGVKYTFDVNFQLGDDEYDRPSTDIIKSYEQQEYANKRTDMKREFAWEWEGPTAAIKASLKSFKTDVEVDYKKFLFYNYEDSTYYWVRMSAGSLKFKRKAYDFWTTNVKLTQQLQ